VESALREAATEAGLSLEPSATPAIPVVRRRRFAARARLGTALAAIIAGVVVVGWLVFGGGHESSSAANAPASSDAVADVEAAGPAVAARANGTVAPAPRGAAPEPVTAEIGKGAVAPEKRAKPAPKRENRNATLDPFKR
jgi:hypothetical protein